MSLTKVIFFFGIVVSIALYWATSNVCRYNFALEKNTNDLNIVTEEIDPTLGSTKYYEYTDLNCNSVNLGWDFNRVIKNVKTVTIIIYQQLNTYIKGNPNYFFIQ